ncbi:MAG: procyclic acidic repetitive family protein [bacterium]|nr:procyclic acidic repetitive family protein [bacterium]
MLAGALASSYAPLAGQQLRYNLRPSVTWTEWDESLGLGKARSLGASAGLGFGEYVDLTAFYRKSDSRSTHMSSLPFTAGMRMPPADQQLEIDSWGAEVSLGFARGSLVPVLMGGAGILRFRPEASGDIRRVQLRYGVGLRTRVLGLFDGEVMVERSRYYLDPLELAAPVSVGDVALPEDPGAGALRRNLALRVGLMLQLGEPDYPSWSDGYRAGDRRFRSPSSSAAVLFEPFGGAQAFDPAFGIDDQAIAGFRAGFELGPSVGLRGFYWRGVDDRHAWEDGIRGYGGEAQFNLGGLALFSPHLLAGAGRMEFGPELASQAERVPADRTTLIVGGGLDLGLGRHLRLTAAARDYIMSRPDLDAAAVDFEDVRDPGDLVHNWQMSAGLKILVGGGSGPRRPDFGRDDLAAMEDRLAERVDARLDEMERRMEETASAEAATPVEVGPQDAPVMAVEPEPAPPLTGPEPTPGEPAIEPAPGLEFDPEPFEPETDFPEQVFGDSRLDPALGFPARELRPYTGVLGGPDTQWIFGVAADWGPSDHLKAFNFVPEASLSLGQGKPSWLVAANLQYRPPWLYQRDSWWISPVTSFGLGVLNQDGSELVLNASWGVTVQLSHVRGISGEPLNLYIAHQGIDLFRKERLILGMSVER